MLPSPKFLRAKRRRSTSGSFLSQLNDDESGNEDRGSPGQLHNSRIAEPVFTISVFEHDLECSEADRHGEDSPPVTFLQQAQIHWLLFHGEPYRRDQQYSGNDVDVKDEWPSVVVGQPSAEERPHGRSESCRDGEHGHANWLASTAEGT